MTFARTLTRGAPIASGTAVFTLALLVLSGCTTGGDTGTPATQFSSVPRVSSTGTSDKVTIASTCVGALPATVGKDFGITVISAKSSGTAVAGLQCVYATDTAPQALTVTVYESTGSVTWPQLTAALQKSGPVKQVNGLGSHAELGATELDLEFGLHLISIKGAVVGADPKGAEALGQDEIAGLG